MSPADLDPVGLLGSFASTLGSVATHPWRGAAPGTAAVTDLARVGASVAGLLAGRTPADVPADEAGDRRFDDPAFQENPAYFAVHRTHLVARRCLAELVAAADVEEVTRRKAAFTAGLVMDALAPTNFLPTNPAALKRAFDTGGRSLVAGARNALRDLGRNGGPLQVDTSGFEVGRNLAATPGAVVHRNRLVEIIQYRPQTEQVHEVPLLVSPPWINKYYVLDLAPERSLVEWAVRHGRTVFVLSYRKPDGSMRDLSMDDYLTDGLWTALDVVTDITGTPTVDLLGLCVGGLLTALTTAYDAATDRNRIGTLTMLNAMLDFSDPGVLGNFTDRQATDRPERRMSGKGYLDGSDMATTFDLLRANDLVFNYVSSGWLRGEAPPPMDILAWNSDSTRIPQRMHLSYLRSFYGDNAFANGTFEVAGTPVVPADIGADTYIVAAENDHIVPWRSSYLTTRLASGNTRFVLSSGGHIAGVVNPPGPKARLRAGGEYVDDADAWAASVPSRQESWWEDWAEWAATRAGDLVSPPPLGSEAHPVLGEAPGEHVRG